MAAPRISAPDHPRLPTRRQHFRSFAGPSRLTVNSIAKRSENVQEEKEND